MNKKALRFYNENKLTNILADGSQISLFGAKGTPLGESSSSPTKTCLLATDEACSIIGTHHPNEFQTLQYSAYGNRPTNNNTTELGYNGELLETYDFYLLGHGNRTYSTSLMRFLSPDRIGVFYGTNFNAYAYAAGDPINRCDPSGNTPELMKRGLRAIGLMAPAGTKQYKKVLAQRKKLNKLINSFPEKKEEYRKEVDRNVSLIKELTNTTKQKNTPTPTSFILNTKNDKPFTFSYETDLNNELSNLYFNRENVTTIREYAETIKMAEFNHSYLGFLEVHIESELLMLGESITNYKHSTHRRGVTLPQLINFTRTGSLK